MATEEGLTRLYEENDQTLAITNFTAVNGMPVSHGRILPVRDVAVDATGTAWLATAGGLYRIAAQGGEIASEVQDTQGTAVTGAEIELFNAQCIDDTLRGTPFRAITDPEGHFVLPNLPEGRYCMQVDGRLADGGPLTSTQLDVEVIIGQQTQEIIELTPLDMQLVRLSGDAQTGVVGTMLPQPLVVEVRDRQGRPMTNVPVTFSIIEGMGSLAPNIVQTNADGQAATQLTLGAVAGRIWVEARIDRLQVRFTSIGLANRDKARLQRVSGDRQTVEEGGFAVPLVVRLEDEFGNPIVGEDIAAELIQGEATFLSASRITTNAEGDVTFPLQVDSVGKTIIVETSVPALEVQEQSFGLLFHVSQLEIFLGL